MLRVTGGSPGDDTSPRTRKTSPRIHHTRPQSHNTRTGIRNTGPQDHNTRTGIRNTGGFGGGGCSAGDEGVPVVDDETSTLAGMVLDLNSDLGEGFGIWPLTDDDALLDVVTSANVACGFHAGDPTVLRRVTERSAERGVAIGAQVGYRDLAGFGRRFIDVDPAELVNDVIYQIGALDGFARIAGTRVRYVKPHGALYNTVAHHTAQAEAVVDAVRRYDPTLPILGLPGSELLRLADEANLPTVAEAFADRAYTPEGRLVSRREPGAVIHDADTVVARSVRMATDGTVTAIDGTDIDARPRSLCLHGDTAGAVDLARRVRTGLLDAGVELAPFA